MPSEKLSFTLPLEPRLRQIALQLLNHSSDRRTVAQWAHFQAMSERTLARLVHKQTGMTFGRWRQQLHLIVALKQLSEGDSVQRVADSLGYESVTAFITMFKKQLGKPPMQYLKQQRETLS